MRNKRWAIVVLLCLALALAACDGNNPFYKGEQPVQATPVPDLASGSCGVDVSWRLDGRGVLYISGWGPMRDYWGSEVRKDGWPGWHDYADQLTAVHIEEGVTSVGGHAFEDCGALRDVFLPESITLIRNHAFKDCVSLEALKLPVHLTEIDTSAFENCVSLTRIEIPAEVNAMGNEIFTGCDSLTEIVVAAGNET